MINNIPLIPGQNDYKRQTLCKSHIVYLKDYAIGTQFKPRYILDTLNMVYG